jgi:hypothetical protein
MAPSSQDLEPPRFPGRFTEATVAAILFFWPIAFEALSSLPARLRSGIFNPWPRLVLVGCTVFGVTWLVTWGQQVRYGASIAYLSGASYAWALWALIKRKREGLNPNGLAAKRR